MVASSSWNAGGSWIEPRDAMKGLYESEITVNGPAKLSQLLPFPACNAPKGANGLPLYYKEIAVLAFQQSPSNTICNAAAVINLSEKMNSDGLLTWDVPAGSWVIARFITSNTGQTLMVPSPNSNGLIIDHLDGNAARSHFRYIIDQILKVRPSLDALRYMEVDSVEVDNQTDWTDSFVAEFRKRRGYDPVPYLPVLKGKSFADPQVTTRFQHDYRKTVSDLWIDGHYAASREILNTYGMQLVAEGGHGGEPRTEPLRSCGVVDITRGEFWNGSQFWVVKEAASAAHIYGRQIVDSESFTGWRHWQDGPLEYKRLADTAFCDGLNRITFHTFAHTPPQEECLETCITQASTLMSTPPGGPKPRPCCPISRGAVISCSRACPWPTYASTMAMMRPTWSLPAGLVPIPSGWTGQPAPIAGGPTRRPPTRSEPVTTMTSLTPM